MRKFENIMGMPIFIDIPDTSSSKPFNAAFDVIRQIDDKFSPFKPTSELFKLWSGKIKESELSDEMLLIKKECGKYQNLTDGYFSANYKYVFNPTGFVKGWAIKKVAEEIEKFGFKTYFISAGGDILAKSDGDKTWDIGLQQTQYKKPVLGKISTKNLAVATSGNYERGNHIYDPHNHLLVTDLISVTITGPDIVFADVLATAVFAMGRKGLDFIKHQKGYEALLIDPELRPFYSHGFATAN